MKNVFIFCICLLFTGLFLGAAGCTQAPTGMTAPAPVPDVATVPAAYTANETLVAFVNEAAAYVKTHGPEEALAEFGNRNGSFVRGELYIYAYGFNGTTLAHPINPESVGKIREGANGVFVQEMGASVRNGSGFYRFTYINPLHNDTLESKLGYGTPVADDWWIGSGIYTGPVNPVATRTSAIS